jgi:tRNA 2-(methylsulfanyl)-N6-isopentenyladenosine37 hydroxylase
MFCLKVATDAAWAAEAMRDVNSVLLDHAHCEMKAASNALSLVARYPADLEVTRVLADLAGDEIEHFRSVLAVLAARGVRFEPPRVDLYASGLRRAAAALPNDAGVTPLGDRLLVGALIEARSCERFQLLAREAREGAAHPELAALWSELVAAEARHYRTFVDLAVRAAGDRAPVLRRLERLSEVEGALVAALARGELVAARATIHG